MLIVRQMQSEPHGLLLELFAISTSVFLAHRSLSNGLILLSTKSGEAQGFDLQKFEIVCIEISSPVHCCFGASNVQKD